MFATQTHDVLGYFGVPRRNLDAAVNLRWISGGAPSIMNGDGFEISPRGYREIRIEAKIYAQVTQDSKDIFKFEGHRVECHLDGKLGLCYTAFCDG